MNDQPTALERFWRGIIPENPTYRQVLGMCPTLAVTTNVQGAITMAAATTFVLVCANIMVSLLRKIIKPHLRILVFTLTIATFVTIADYFLQAFMPEMSAQLGPYIPLIIVNCIIISRCEVCASKQSLVPAIADGFGQGLGFLLGLCSIAVVRELFGSGTLMGYTVLSGDFWVNCGIMILPPGAFLTLGCLMAFFNWIGSKKQEN